MVCCNRCEYVKRIPYESLPCVCFLCCCIIGIPILVVGFTQIHLVTQTEGNITMRSYESFNFTVDSSDCAPPSPSPKSASNAYPISVLHYNFFYTIVFFYDNQVMARNACSPFPYLLNGRCSDGTNLYFPEGGITRGPTTCHHILSTNLDDFDLVRLQNNTLVWLSRWKDNIFIYLSDPDRYGKNKLYAGIAILVVAFSFLVCVIYFGLQYLNKNCRWKESGQRARLLYVNE